VPINLLLRSIRIEQFRALFIVLCFSMVLGSCSKVDTKWHRYNGRNFEIIGTDRNLVEVASDGWRIITISDDKHKDEYDWGWEITIKTVDIPNERKFYQGGRYEFLLTIKEIQYILLDEDGFELGKDTLREQSMPYGTTATFRHTGTISKGKALRASKSLYKIILL